MNLIDLHVTKILSMPFHSAGRWWVDVEANAYGRISTHTLMFDTEEQANNVRVGDVFQG